MFQSLDQPVSMQAEADMASPVYNSCVASAEAEPAEDGAGLLMATLASDMSRHLCQSVGVLGERRSFVAAMTVDPRGVQLASLKRASNVK